uniref:Uncharacterized protein n=1 Tax=viral metagenome TaxID=1070528 RepID=A0A6M3JZ90_9ZZZZ
MIKEALYKIVIVDTNKTFIGQYELTTKDGYICFYNHETGNYEYYRPFDIIVFTENKEIE